MAYDAFLTSLYGLSGTLEAGGLINSYIRNTTTRAQLYRDPLGTPFTTNPVVADSLGQLTFYYRDDVEYFWQATTANGATVLWEAIVIGGAVSFSYVNNGLSLNFRAVATGTGASQVVTIPNVTLTSIDQIRVWVDLLKQPNDGASYTVGNDGTDTYVILTAPSGADIEILPNVVYGLTGPAGTPADIAALSTLPGSDSAVTLAVLNQSGVAYKTDLSSAPIKATSETTSATLAAIAASRVKVLTNYAALQSEELVNNKTVLVLGRTTAGKGGGLFRFTSTSSTTQVTNDPQKGIYVPPASATTGSAGVWIRVLDNPRLVTPEMFGAVGDGTTDDYAAIQAAENWLEIDQTGKYSGGTLLLVSRYAMSDQLLIDDFNITIQGDGVERTAAASSVNGSPCLIGTSTTKPVIRVMASDTKLIGFEVRASTARQAGSTQTGDNTACGIMIAPNDAASTSLNRVHCQDMLVRDQVDDGYVVVGDCVTITFERCAAKDNDRHGFLVEQGDQIARTNKERPGIVSFYDCRAVDSGGYNICIGHPSDAGNSPYRILMRNFESFRGGLTTGQLFSTYESCHFFRGEEVMAEGCAFGGTGAGNVAARSCAIISCLDSVFESCRWIEPAGTHFVRLEDITGFTGRSVRFNGGCASVTGAALTYFASIESTSLQMRIDNVRGRTNEYTNTSDRDDITIVSGAISVNLESHQIDTEGAAATDDLVTINGGIHDQIVRFRSVNSARDTTFKNGTGNIVCGVDRVLSNVADEIALRYDGIAAKWNMIYFADNA